MLCAHTIRRLKPGSLHRFVETFGPPQDAEPGNEDVVSNGVYEIAVSRTADGAAH
jgi:hypothetical protein